MLTIKREYLHSIFEHCNAGFPNETCGILAGRDGRVEKVYSMTNAKPGPASYEMDPDEQFRVMKDLREKGLVMIGIYHSHPSGPAYPSRVDVEKAYWPGTLYPNYPDAVYVIVSLMDRANPIVKGFSIVEGTVTEVQLSLM
jgi:proteasome lid subunit RPN8/RPN11